MRSKTRTEANCLAAAERDLRSKGASSMTHEYQTTPASVEVTQADRDRAEAFWQEYGPFRMGTVSALSAAFARHRIAHSAPAGDVEPVAWQVSWHSPIPAVSGGRKIVLTKPDPAEWDAVDPLYTHPAPPADLVELVEALRGIIDDEPCWHDHHGYCQAHYVNSPCEMATARTALAKYLAKHGGA